MQTLHSASRVRARLPYPSLQVQIYLFGLVILSLTVLSVVIGVWFAASQYGYKQVENQIDQGLGALDRELNNDTSDVENIVKWLASDSSFQRLVQERNQTALNQQLQPLMKTSLVDLVIVADDHGKILNQLVTGAAPVSDFSPDALSPGINAALDGREFSRFDRDPSGTLFQKLLVPVFDQSNQKVVGVFVMGFRVDSQYLHQAANRRGLEYALATDDEFVATTLTDQLGRPWKGNFATLEPTDPFYKFYQGNLTLVATGQGPYLFKFAPSQFPGDSQIKRMGAGIPLSVLDDQRALFARLLWIVAAIAGLWLLIGGFLFARSLTVPLNKLGEAIERMIHGDLQTKAGVWRTDEIGRIAWGLERMRKAQLEARQEFARQVKRNAAIIDALSIPVVVTNAKHQIASANASALTLLRHRDQNVFGKPWHSFFVVSDPQDDSLPFWQPTVPSNGDNMELVVRGRFVLRSQPEVILDITSTQVDVENLPEGYVHVLHDISEEERFARAKDQFLLNVAHELQGPLTSWRTSLELLVEDYPNLTPRELGVMLKSLERGAIRFEGLVGVLIDIGKLEAGRFKIRPVPTPITKLVQDGLASIESVLPTKGQSLELHLDCEPDCMVLADRPRIVQVIVNFVRNASKYGPYDQPIVVSVYPRDGSVYVEVTDFGDGIPLEDQVHLFERFFRGKRVEEEGGGIGIGLALCKGILDAHGGQIGVRSELGAGATFWFSLPELNQTTKSIAEGGSYENSLGRR